MFEAGLTPAGSEAAAASLSSLWSAMTPRTRPLAPPPPDVGAIAAAAEAQGYARGRDDAEAALVPERAALRAAVAALDAACAIDPEALRPAFVDLVTRIAEAVIGAELKLSLDAVARLVDAGLASIETAGEAAVYVSPDHAARLGAVADPDLAPGEVRIETPHHVVAASLAARLAAVVADL